MSRLVTQGEFPQLFEECADGTDLEKYQTGSHKHVLWHCHTCDYEWSTEIRVRTSGHGCPNCAGMAPTGLIRRKPQKVEQHESLGAVHPELIPLWDNVKNVFSIFEIKPKSERQVFWKCPKCGHEFQRSPSDQANSSCKCPKCAEGYSSSFGEQLIYFACVVTFGEDKVISRDKNILGFEVDVLVPDYRIGFEYGAWHWHKDKVLEDQYKIEQAKQEGYNIYCIYDDVDTTDTYVGDYAYCIESKTSVKKCVDIERYIQSVFETLNCNIELDWNDIEEQAKSVLESRAVPYEKSFEARYLCAKEEWDYEKNYPVTPADVSAHNEAKYWFKCLHGHSYKATPDHKTSRSDGCPVCRHIVIQPGINSFAAENPQLMPYWDWEKNEENPDSISPLSPNKSEWHWKCPHDGHEWATKQSFSIMKKDDINNKICPACAQRETLLNHISDVHFSTKGTDLFISPSLFPSGDWQHDKKYRTELEEFVRQTIIDNQNNILGNNKFSIIETSYVYIRITKDAYRTISQCYISDRPLGKKMLLDKKGKAQFENITPQDDSFGAHHPEVLLYWDWDKNEKSPFDIHDNIQALKRWHWKCPDCETTWSTTRPIKNGGNASYFCRNCYLRQKLVDLLDNGKIHFYDIKADNGCRDIEPNKGLMDIIEAAGRHGVGAVDMKHKEIIVESDDVTVEIRKESGVIAKVIGMECPEAPWVNDK